MPDNSRRFEAGPDPFGRIWQVNIQAEGSFRKDVDSLKLLSVRNGAGQSVPLASVLRVRNDSGLLHLLGPCAC